MNKKWSPEKVKAVQAWLQVRWPELFATGPDLKPLSLNIYKEILAFRSENADLSGRVLREALKRHCTSFGYLYGMTKNTHRFNLRSEPVELIADAHRNWAFRTLRLLQKISQKNRKPSGNRRVVNTKPVQSRVSMNREPSVARAKTAAPTIRYKQNRRKIRRPSEQTEVLAVGV